MLSKGSKLIDVFDILALYYKPFFFSFDEVRYCNFTAIGNQADISAVFMIRSQSPAIKFKFYLNFTV